MSEGLIPSQSSSAPPSDPTPSSSVATTASTTQSELPPSAPSESSPPVAPALPSPPVSSELSPAVPSELPPLAPSESSGQPQGSGSISVASKSGMNVASSATVVQEGVTSKKAVEEKNAQTTMTTQFELPTGDEDVRRIILDDFDRCLNRHDESLAHLLLIHKSQQSTMKKMKLNIEMANKREKQEKKKTEELSKTVDKMADALGEKKPEDDQNEKKKPSDLAERIEKLKKSFEEINNKLQEKRLKNKELDLKCAELRGKAKEGDSKQRSAEDLAKMSREIEEAKKEIANILQSIIPSMEIYNKRLETEYLIQLDCESAEDVRFVMDQIVQDVSQTTEDKKHVEGETEKLKSGVAELEEHIKHAEKMNEFLSREVKNLLEIGDGKDGEKVDPNNYTEITQFVQTTFDERLKTLKGLNENVAKLKQESGDLERHEQKKQKKFEREMATRKAQMEKRKTKIIELTAENEMLRNSLRKSSKSPSASETQVVIQIKQLKEIRETSERQEKTILENQLKNAKVNCEDSAKRLNALKTEVNDLNEKVLQKEGQLSELKQKIDVDQEKKVKESQELQKQLEDLDKEVEPLERRWAELQGQPINESEKKSSRDNVEDLNKVEKELSDKIAESENKAKQVEEEKTKFLNEFNKLNAERTNYLNQQRKAEMANEDLEDDLANIASKIREAEKRLNRERERGFELDRLQQQNLGSSEPIEFLQTIQLSYPSTRKGPSPVSDAPIESDERNDDGKKPQTGPKPSGRKMSPSSSAEQGSKNYDLSGKFVFQIEGMSDESSSVKVATEPKSKTAKSDEHSIDTSSESSSIESSAKN